MAHSDVRQRRRQDIAKRSGKPASGTLKMSSDQQMARAWVLALVCVWAAWCAPLAAQSELQDIECGALENAYGPFDYTDASERREKLPIVEQFHFNADVENLRRGQSGSIIGDLDYTLRAFPNHHRALNAMARLQLTNPTAAVAPYRSADCYFNRAMRFRPGDGTVRMIYGTFLFKRGERDAALKRYEEAVALLPESAEAHYNMGLLQVELKRYDQALEQAHKAYALGYPLQGLKNRLKRAGKWREPKVAAIP
jgi:tetratricopeptide (TPR) repeat protein